MEKEEAKGWVQDEQLKNTSYVGRRRQYVELDDHRRNKDQIGSALSWALVKEQVDSTALVT